MRGIDKNKHALLLRGLHELLDLAADPAEINRIKTEIDVLNEEYERYMSLVAEAVQCAATYNIRHNEARRMLCRTLRHARRA